MMKKTVLALGASVILGSTAMAADTVRIGSEGAYAPWNYLDDSGKLAGFEIDLGMDLCQRAELSCEFVANEWDSIIPNLLAGNYDMIMAGMSITDERKETIDFSADYFPPDPSRFVVAKGNSIDFDNLKGKKIGAQGATIQAAHVETTYGADNTVLSFETPDQSVADLMAGNIDVLFADGAYLEPIVEGSGGAVEFAGPDVMIGGGVGIGLRKDDADLQAKMAAALESAKADGTVDKLIAEYFEKGPFYAN
ncbi:MAG: transporter substrate-binding domain-containing protein [Granulosicoccaceae bacterium]